MLNKTAANSAAMLGSVLTRAVAIGTMTLFALTSAWAGAKNIYAFKSGNDGALPYASLISDSAGNLYGTTGSGGGATACGTTDQGVTGCGTLFELVKNAEGYQEQVLYRFQGGNDGIEPRAGLTMDAAGNLYGTTIDGGGSLNCYNGCGTIYKLTKGSNGAWTESVLYAFQGPAGDGQGPMGQVILDSEGNLYGTTSYGGSSVLACDEGCGTVFKLIPTSSGPWTENIIYTFTNNGDGAIPAGHLAVDASGNLYGTTALTNDKDDSGGTVFELSPMAGGSWTLNTLFTFSGVRTATTGVTPNGGVILDAEGNLYGTTLCGGSAIRTPGWSPCEQNFGYGNVFKLSPGTDGIWTEQVLYTFFNFENAVFPDTALIFDPAGNLYGTTYYGGARNAGAGTVFELTPTASGEWTEKVLARFDGDAINDGRSPYDAVLMDGSGNLFGTTYAGGKYDFGVVYEVTP